MYNSKPSSVSHKDGGDNSLIPAWSFLSLPWLLRLDLARNLMTLLAALSHSESCSCHSWPRGAIWDTPEPLTHVRTAFQIWSAQLLHPPPTLDKATGAVWFYFIFFSYFSSGLQLALAVWKSNFTPLICYEIHFLKQLCVLILPLQRK